MGEPVYNRLISWGWIVIPTMGVLLNMVARGEKHLAQFFKFLQVNYLLILRMVQKLTSWGLLVLCTLCWGLIAARIIKYPENHIAFNVLWLNVLFGGILTFGLLSWGISKRFDWLNVTVIAIALASIIGVLCLYYWNILVPYEEWIRRGMPDRPF